MTTGSVPADAPLAHASQNADRFQRQLFDLLRIPSISTQPEHAADCAQAALFLAEDMRTIGMHKVEIHPTPGHSIVFAEWNGAGDDAPTVLVYGHYDVQPADPLEQWRTPPFEPTVRDGNVYARGASDDKGQLFVHLKAVESWLSATGHLPVNVKFLLEGEEESGSPNLEPFIRDNQGLLRADTCLISDTHMLSESQPALIASLRGMAYCELWVHGPTHDLHSGTFGGAVRNPGETLCRLIAQLKDDDGRISIPDFYDDVRELHEHERELLAQVPYDESSFCREAGISQPWGERGFTPLELVGARPTLEVNGLLSGYTGEGAKTVLPASAMAKVSFRLVPDQRASRIAGLFAQRISELAPPEVRVETRYLHGGDPSRVDIDAPGVRAAAQALHEEFGAEPVFTREGGSIPVVTLFDELLGMPTVLMGFGLPDDRLHSPNEKMALSQFERGIRASIRFMARMAA